MELTEILSNMEREVHPAPQELPYRVKDSYWHQTEVDHDVMYNISQLKNKNHLMEKKMNYDYIRPKGERNETESQHTTWWDTVTIIPWEFSPARRNLIFSMHFNRSRQI